MEKETKPRSTGPDHIIENSIQNPDQLQSGLAKVGDFVLEHARSIFGLVCIGLLVWLGYIGYGVWLDRQEVKAQDALFAAESKILKLKEGFDKARMESLMPSLAKNDVKKEAPATLATGDLQKDYGDLPNQLESVIVQYPKSKSAAQAAIAVADLYLEYKQPEKAENVLSPIAQNFSKNSIFSGLVNAVLGKALAQKGECEKATTIWQKILDEKSQSYIHADIALKAGICFESLGQVDKAKGMYKKASEDFSEMSEGKRTAKSLLRALELKANPTKG